MHIYVGFIHRRFSVSEIPKMCRVSLNYKFVITQLCITLWTTFKIFVTVRKGKIKLPPTVFWEAVLFRD
ncbi:Hypothetical protein CpMEX9_0002 [Corynebacterium pseudotuberculosis]|nr:Hypothetical protein Cp12C_0002 [Corynebacterium pseudotuberculosis]ANH22794.1 Hypothetical protein CpE55_0002 [Corynebacterium pseudotuberculosis]ANH24839.1 Hypothetical protein CpMEX9_0002 [Corynebacterium pseudotuberculosis]